MPALPSLQGFLAPKESDTYIIVLTDAEHSSSVLLSSSNAVVLTGRATEIIYKAFFASRRRQVSTRREAADDAAREEEPLRLATIVGVKAAARDSATRWLTEFTDEGVLSLVTEPPVYGVVDIREIEAGEPIAPNPVPGRAEISVESDGELRHREINGTGIYWYESSASFTRDLGVTVPATEGSVLTRGEIMGTMLLPRPIGGGVGLHCGACAGCASCGGCALCLACGPSPAAALGLVGVDTTLGVVAAAASSLAFESLRDLQ